MAIKRNNRGEFESIAFAFEQNGKTILLTILEHDDLQKVAFTEQFSEDNIKGNQRTISENHSEQFARAIRQKGVTRPQSIVGSLCGGARWEPHHIKSQIGKIIFPANIGKFISLQDGQHSVKAVDLVYADNDNCKNRIEWNWAVTLFPSSDWKEKIRIHNAINAHQKKSDKSHLLHQQLLIGETDKYVTRAGKLLLKLNDDETSILHNRIKLFDSQKKRLSMNDILGRIAPVFRLAQVEKMSDDEIYAIMWSYFNEWKEQYAHIWDDQGNFIISINLGLNVLSAFLFDVVKHLALIEGKIKFQEIQKIIRRIKSKNMNWSRNRLVEVHGYQDAAHLHRELLRKSGLIKKEGITDESE